MTLHAELETHLQRELGDAATAQDLAAILLEETLSWRAPVDRTGAHRHSVRLHLRQSHAAERQSRTGSGEPGACRCRGHAAPAHRGARLRAMGGRRGAGRPCSGRAGDRDQSGSRCTRRAGVSQHHRRAGGNGAPWPNRSRSAVSAWWRLPIICIAASRPHAGSASMPTRRLGLPCRTLTIPQSGQAWCRDRIAYLLHDIMIRITERRAAVVGTMWR